MYCPSWAIHMVCHVAVIMAGLPHGCPSGLPSVLPESVNTHGLPGGRHVRMAAMWPSHVSCLAEVANAWQAMCIARLQQYTWHATRHATRTFHLNGYDRIFFLHSGLGGQRMLATLVGEERHPSVLSFCRLPQSCFQFLMLCSVYGS